MLTNVMDPSFTPSHRIEEPYVELVRRGREKILYQGDVNGRVLLRVGKCDGALGYDVVILAFLNRVCYVNIVSGFKLKSESPRLVFFSFLPLLCNKEVRACLRKKIFNYINLRGFFYTGKF